MIPALPNLQSFLAAWVHQDYDLESETLDGLVAAFARVSDAATVAALRVDLRRCEQALLAGTRLDQLLELEVEPSAFAESELAFIRDIERALAKH
jgi:CdiI immunity protein